MFDKELEDEARDLQYDLNSIFIDQQLADIT